MVEAHDLLQRAAAEMNTLRTRSFLNNSDVEMLSQQLSQIPADFSSAQSVVSPSVAHRSKRSRVADTTGTRTAPLSPLKNQVNVTPTSLKPEKRVREISSSVTRDDGEYVDNILGTKSDAIGNEYGDLIPDEEGFSQFDI